MQTCMIVDDSSVIRKVASRIIVHLDFTVSDAATGAEALELFGGAPLPDVIIVAGALPDMPGDDFIRAVRIRPDGAAPVILGSLVEAHLGLMTRLKRAGANGFIYKPFDRQALTEWMQPYRRKAA